MRDTLVLSGLVLGYSWLAVPLWGIQRWLATLVILAGLGFCLNRAWVHGEWGLDRNHFLPCLGWALIFTLPALAVFVTAGVLLDTLNWRGHPGRMFGFLFLWAWSQQFALHTIVLREARARVGDRRGPLLAAGVFSLLHFPNPFLVPLTFGAALAWCWIYSRHANLLPLALSHAASSVTILFCLSRDITGGMRIGYSYFM